MDREQIEKWAREAGMWSDLYSHWTCSPHQIEHFARLVRDAALEEAKQALAPTSPDGNPWRSGWVSTTALNDVLRQKQAAIDALRSKP